ncbi:hypothetical protein [Vulgatibacter sp.]|uniref:hypothetical protein n=1 Tax=Vulgatibacter sp. TaxID=1971226 RepID=UPI0035676754
MSAPTHSIDLVAAVDRYRQRAAAVRGAGRLPAHFASDEARALTDAANTPKALLEDLIRQAERTASQAEALARKAREIVAGMEAP